MACALLLLGSTLVWSHWFVIIFSKPYMLGLFSFDLHLLLIWPPNIVQIAIAMVLTGNAKVTELNPVRMSAVCQLQYAR